MYYSFVYPYLIYGNLIWGNASATALWPIYKLQKLAIRIITNTPRGKSTKLLCKKLRILRLPDIYSYNIIIFMYKFKNNMMPPSLDHLFHTNNSIHRHNTRGASNLRAPRIRSLMAEKCITTTGVHFWNLIITKINTTLKISTFKQKLITYLLSEYLG